MVVAPISTKVRDVIEYDFLAASQANIMKIALMSFHFFLDQKSFTSRTSA